MHTAKSLLPELRDPFHLDRIACPVLLVWGDRDRLVFTTGAERVLATVPGARMEVIEGCGHCPQIEVPERFVNEIESFLAAPLTAAA
jgi:pimeloyl-ACP methyl ester carboxylesterase